MFERLNTPEEPQDDRVILSGALETEHHEIAVCEGLIISARAMGRDDVVENLEQEQHALQEVRAALERVTAVSSKPA